MNLPTSLFFNNPPFPKAEFWRALLTAHQHLLVEYLCRTHNTPQEVIDAINLLDCVIDIAIENDWLADTVSED